MLLLLLSTSVGCGSPPQQPEASSPLPSENGTEAVPNDAVANITAGMKQFSQGVSQLCTETQELTSEAANLQAVLCDEPLTDQVATESSQSSMGQPSPLLTLAREGSLFFGGIIIGFLLRRFLTPQPSPASDKGERSRSRRGQHSVPPQSFTDSPSSGGGFFSFITGGGTKSQGSSRSPIAEEIKARQRNRSPAKASELAQSSPQNTQDSGSYGPPQTNTGQGGIYNSPTSSRELVSSEEGRSTSESAHSSTYSPSLLPHDPGPNQAVSSPPVFHQPLSLESQYNQDPASTFRQVRTEVEDISIDRRRSGLSSAVILQNANRGSLGVFAGTHSYYLIPRDRPSANEKLQDYFEIEGQQFSGSVYLHQAAVVVPQGGGQWQLTQKGRISFC